MNYIIRTNFGYVKGMSRGETAGQAEFTFTDLLEEANVFEEEKVPSEILAALRAGEPRLTGSVEKVLAA